MVFRSEIGINPANVRLRMVEIELERGVTRDEMAKEVDISRPLLGMVVHGEVTHPEIAKRIAKVYDLSELEYEQLIPKHRRPHDPAYDPEMFMDHIDRSKVGVGFYKRNLDGADTTPRGFLDQADGGKVL